MNNIKLSRKRKNLCRIGRGLADPSGGCMLGGDQKKGRAGKKNAPSHRRFSTERENLLKSGVI